MGINQFTPEHIEEKLRNIFSDTFEKQNIPEFKRAILVEKGLQHFSYGNMGVESLGGYPSIFEFVRIHQDDILGISDDKSPVNKEILFRKLVGIAESGDLRDYRRIRAQYSAAL